MKVTLISLNAKYVHLAPAPYALGAGVLAFARRAHTVSVFNGVVGKSRDALWARLESERPDAVAFSVYIWNVAEICALVPCVRALLPHAVIILGGPEVSYSVENTFSLMPETDYILSGEGEEPFARLLDALEAGEDVASVAGCSYRTGDGVCVATPFVGKGTPPSPLDFGYAEALDGRIAYLEGARGCPYSCAFCLSGRCGGVRYFDIDRVKNDLLRLANAKTRTVKFVDRTFNADRARAKELWRFLIEKRATGEIPQDVCFHFEIAGELLEDESLALLAAAPRGLFQMEIGVQSFHGETLRAIHRATGNARLCENIRRLVAMGNIHVHIDLIAGLPEEDLATFRAGFDRAFSLGAHMLQLGFLKLLHGAPMRESPEAYPCTFEGEPPYTVTSTPLLSAADLADISLCEMGCERLYNSGKYSVTLAAALASGESPYELLREAGQRLSRLSSAYTMDDEVALLLDFFAARLGAARARDLLLLDFLSYNPSCYVPKALRREDGMLARVKAAVARCYPQKKGVRRALVLLYTEGVAAFADYDMRDPVTGLYAVRKIRLNELNC